MPTIIPTTAAQTQDIARRLLDAADSPDDVRTDTSGARTAFVVSDKLAAAAGFDVTDDNVTDADDDPDLTNPEPQVPEDNDPHAQADAVDSPAVVEPPRGGKGSGGQVWLTFLNEQGVAVPEHLGADDRDELVELWDAHLDTKA